MSALGKPIIVINGYTSAAELLDRRAGKYSDRPLNIVGCEIMSGGLMLAFSRYGDMCVFIPPKSTKYILIPSASWRRMRKAAHEAVNKVVVHGLDEHLSAEALALARDGIQDPSSWDDHLRRAAANAMLTSMYGERPVSKKHVRHRK